MPGSASLRKIRATHSHPEHLRLTVTHLRLTLWRSSVHVLLQRRAPTKAGEPGWRRRFVYGRLLLAIGQTRRKSETTLGSACAAASTLSARLAHSARVKPPRKSGSLPARLERNP